jgi:GPH family glycoside/pentoside/hexuronide:cation symporter
MTMTESSPGARLSLKTKLGYGVCDLGGNLFFTVTAFLLMNFLTEQVGLAPGLAGLALMIGRVWDAFADPTVGMLSDRTRTRFGRRRPYMFVGGLLLFVGMTVIFTLPGIDGQAGKFIWATAAYCLVCTAFTIVNIPYSALTPDLTDDFNERTVLNGYRMSFAVVGSLCGAGAALPLVSLFDDKATGYTVMGATFGAVMLVTSWITVFVVREPPPKTDASEHGVLSLYLVALKNRAFLFLLGSWVAHTVGITILAGTMLYYFQYIFHAEDKSSVALLALLVTAMVFIPMWVWLSKRFGKRPCSIAGMLVIVATLIPLYFFGPSLGLPLFMPLMVVAGVGMSTQYVFPYASIPDVVEYDYAETGVRKEGIYYGIWNLAVKVGQALAGALIGWILAIYGYSKGVPASDDVIFGIRLLFGPVPMLIYLLGALSLYFYPISQAAYAELMQRIKAREGRV